MLNKIKQLRKNKGLTQQDLANLVNVRRETIIFLEQGKYNPSLELAHKVAAVFKVKIENVFIFED